VSDQPALIITADDYGYRPSYNRGILEAARAGAVDAVSAMVRRDACHPQPLLAAGVEIGLHVELPEPGTRAASAAEQEAALAALREQLDRFESLFGRPAAYLDGHHHCHARAGLAEAMADEARQQGLAVRSIDAAHRRLLRRMGVATPDRLVGRFTDEEAALPEELRPAVEDGTRLPPGVTEWMVHPGYPDPSFDPGSDYDRGREEDLDLLLGLRLQSRFAGARLTHLAALG
jgi:predicted glycoside hydrolase/deacetylase ChbG (UPF0249 family)